jgi:hypothetical protein
MKTKLTELKSRFIKAKSAAEKKEIDIEMQKLINLDPDLFANSMVELARQTADDAEELVLKSQLKEILPVLSVSYIAKNYFDKSRQWFYQKLNGNIVNGKPAKFTKEEIETLNFALKDLSKKLGSLEVS